MNWKEQSRDVLRTEVQKRKLGSATWRISASKDELAAALEANDASQEQPKAEPAAPKSDKQAAVKTLLDLLSGEGLDEERVRAIAREEAAKAHRPNVVEVRNIETGTVKNVGVQHERFATLVKFIAARVPTWLVGPAGSGKTTVAEKAAEALEMAFEFNGAIDSEHKLLGFVDAQGRVVSRPFRKAFTGGGVYLFDEIDASLPAALLAFNAGLANGYMDFPDKKEDRHADFIPIAGANTYDGTGQYAGRMKQDKALLDRFAFLDWPYDERLECNLAGVDYRGDASPWKDEPIEESKREQACKDWVYHVQARRAGLRKLGSLQHIISPRATLYGQRLIRAGVSWQVCEKALLQKGLTDEQYKTIGG